MWAEGGRETAPAWPLGLHGLLWGTRPNLGSFLHNMLTALSALPFLPGVQAREKQPAEPPAPLRRRAASDGQYENQSPEPSSPRSPGVRSPVQCVPPELALTIALNPGGRPKEVSPRATSWAHRGSQSPSECPGTCWSAGPHWPVSRPRNRFPPRILA